LEFAWQTTCRVEPEKVGENLAALDDAPLAASIVRPNPEIPVTESSCDERSDGEVEMEFADAIFIGRQLLWMSLLLVASSSRSAWLLV
jgi:hypothetical protein